MPIPTTTEQEIFRDSAKRYLQKVAGPTLSRAAFSDSQSVHDEIWKDMADMGWLGLGVDAAHGGVRGDFSTLSILLEEMGRVCLPGPFFSSVVLSSLFVSEIATGKQQHELLSDVVMGATTLTLAIQEGFSEFHPDEVETTARHVGANYVLSGRKRLVPYAGIADIAICVSRVCDESNNPRSGFGVFPIPLRHSAVSIKKNQEIGGSISHDVAINELSVSAAALLGDRTVPWGLLEKLLLKAAVMKCSEMVGGAQRAMEIAVEFAKERRQFGRPIGTFQAVQHHCSNMLMYVELARRMTDEALSLLDKDCLSNARAAATKAWCNLAYREVVRLAHQVLGGAGYIDQHAMPWHFRHARTCESTLGDCDTLLDIVAEALFADAQSDCLDGWPSLFAA